MPRSQLIGRERAVTLALAGSFLAAAALCAALLPSEMPFSATTAALLIGLYVVVSQVEFEIGPGSAVPTELVLVPMLFLLPPGSVPLCVACGLVLGGVIEQHRSRRHGQRVAVLVCSAWHSVGPAIVVAVLAPGSPRWQELPAYGLALAAQFAFDAAAVIARHRLGRGVRLADLVPTLSWVALVDCALAPVALVIAFAASAEPWVVLCVLPLAGLLHALGAERRRGIDESLVLGQAVQDASREARSDPLTEVGNRLAWQEALERAQQTVEHVATTVLLVDLDRLKETNDRYGHDVGDRHIQALGAALRRAIREGDELARIGGDEFAVLAFGADERNSLEIESRIRAQLAGLLVAGVPLTAALGSASCPPCPTLADAVRLADERLYAEKTATRVRDP